MSEQKVWFITGSSSGFGRELAELLLKKGEKVVLTARNRDSIKDLTEKYAETAKALKLDVTDKNQIEDAVKEAVKTFGRIDVLVNNAAYGLIGAVEEAGEEQIKAQFETNILGVINVLRAVLPQLRQQKSGHILNMSSTGGFQAGASAGYYSATKFGLEGLSQALAQEVAPHGIRVTIVEPGPFRTDFAGRSLNKPENQMPEVYPTTGKLLEYFENSDGKQAGDPRKAAQVMFDVVNSDNPPLRLPLGKIAYERFDKELEDRKNDIAFWKENAKNTDFEETEAKIN